MRSRAAWTVGVVALASSLAVVLGAAPASAGPQNGISWQHSESANGYWRPPRGDSAPPSGPARVWVQWSSTNELHCPDDDEAFACTSDEEAEILGILCPTTIRGPRGLPLFAWIRWERDIVNGEPGRWVGREAGCDEPRDDDFIPMEEISWEVNYRVFQHLRQPTVKIAPNARTLVNLPTIVWTDYPRGIDPDIVVSNDPPTIEIDIHIDRPNGGLDGRIRASAELTWQFEGGATARGRGRPYVRGVLPEDRPGYYVTNVFHTPGEKTVTLNTRWTGTVTVDLLGTEEIVPVTLPPVSTSVQVAEAEPVIGRTR
jgi:hypothetical protein